MYLKNKKKQENITLVPAFISDLLKKNPFQGQFRDFVSLGFQDLELPSVLAEKINPHPDYHLLWHKSNSSYI